MLHSPSEEALVQSNMQLQITPAKSSVDKPVNSTSLLENQKELVSSCEELSPTLPASKNGPESSLSHSLKSRKLPSSPTQKQVDNATVVPGDLNHLVATFVTTCSRSSPRASASSLKLNSQPNADTMQHLKYTDGLATHAVPSAGDKQNYACLETDTNVVFTIEKPGQMEKLPHVQEMVNQSGKVKSARSGNKEPVSPMFMVDKTSFPQYRFHLYQVPQYDQQVAVPDSCATTQRHQGKQSTDKEQVKFPTGGNHRQNTWDGNTDNQVLPLNSSTTPSGPWVIPVYRTPTPPAVSHPELSHAAVLPSNAVGLLKSVTWPWPSDMPAYSSVQTQESQLCGGNLGVAQVQGGRGELSAAPLPPSSTPKIMLTSSCQPIAVPYGMSNNGAAVQEPVVHPFGGYGFIPQSNGMGSVLLHPQFAPFPMVGTQAFPINCPLWACSLNSVPILQMPSATPYAKFPQYPNILEMFKTAKLLPEHRAASNDHHPKARVRPGSASRLPQDTIQVNLKVQDNTTKPATKNAVSEGQVKESSTQCSVCRKTFARTSTLKSHMRIHTGEKPYKCLVCGRFFPQYGSLKTHERCHTGEKPYQCGLCKKSFSHSSSLRTHARIHTGERPYHCTWPGCGKQFTDKSTLMKHQCVHTKVKPHKCPDCGLQFTQVGNMRKHQAKIHGAAKRRGTPAENDAALVQRCAGLGRGASLRDKLETRGLV